MGQRAWRVVTSPGSAGLAGVNAAPRVVLRGHAGKAQTLTEESDMSIDEQLDRVREYVRGCERHCDDLDDRLEKVKRERDYWRAQAALYKVMATGERGEA